LFEEFFTDLARENLARVFFYPEFLREGTAVRDFQVPSLSVVGAGPELGDAGDISGLDELWQSAPEVVDWETAELLKYACNAFHATKVDFGNEIGRLSKSIGIDGQRVMNLLCRDSILNISPYYMRPGNPFGGSCLPKDVSALEIFGQNRGVALPVIENLRESNHKHLQHLLSLVEARDENDVIIIGLAFKKNTDDLRGSAMVDLASELVLGGRTVRIYDPRVKPERLIGANEKLTARKLPGLDTLLTHDLAQALGEKGTVVVFNQCVETEPLVKALQPAHHIIDVNGWRELASSAASYEGLCW
jgi:GDP-mannose 6-dehydrogenase